MVLGGHHHVFLTSLSGEFRPGARGVRLRLKGFGEPLVLDNRNGFVLHGPFVTPKSTIESPMNEHAETSLVPPPHPALAIHIARRRVGDLNCASQSRTRAKNLKIIPSRHRMGLLRGQYISGQGLLRIRKLPVRIRLKYCFLITVGERHREAESSLAVSACREICRLSIPVHPVSETGLAAHGKALRFQISWIRGNQKPSAKDRQRNCTLNAPPARTASRFASTGYKLRSKSVKARGYLPG